MCQTLFYIPETFFGLPVFGVGWGLIFLAVITALLIAVPKLRRQSPIGATLATALIFAAVIVFVIPNLVEPQHGIPIRGYGFCLLLAIFCSLALVIHLAKPHHIPSESFFSLCLWTVICGVIGARIFYVTEYWQDMIIFDAAGNLRLPETLFGVINIANGGLVVFGSMIGGFAGAVFCMIRLKMPILATFDAMAPAMMLGLAIGRVGCFLNGCCFGGVCELPWAVTFPAGSPAHIHQIEHGDIFYNGVKFKEAGGNVIIAEVQPDSEAARGGLEAGMPVRGIAGFVHSQEALTVWNVVSVRELVSLLQYLQMVSPSKTVRFDIFSNPERTQTQPRYVPQTLPTVLPVHPTQIYSSLTALFICGVLLILGRLPFYRPRAGLVFASFLMLYPAARFLLEIIRTDEDSFLGTGLTVSQNMSIAVFMIGVVLFCVLAFKKMKS
ncbi:prolipoprotein diacylglyceryl transferase [Planctomycetales bacterium]|nr:prolipoprotein diacylglyceryl transferase [Planctomycetales bacterium]